MAVARYPIRYLCLSDIHLGEEDGLLTNLVPGQDEVDPLRPSPVLMALSDALSELVRAADELPSLIILGDGLELALSGLNQAAMVFERLLEVFFCGPERLFKEIIYIPGNHDHHIWEVAREVQYAGYIARQHPQGSLLPPAWHHSRMLMDKPHYWVKPLFLEAFVHRVKGLEDLSVKVAYPNFGLLNKETKKAVCFHHGHLLEPIYLLMSILKNILFPQGEAPEQIEQIISRIYAEMDIDQIEGENFAWIDFFWSTMGRSGEAGEKVETIYERLQSLESLKEMIDHLAQAIAQKLDIPYIPGDFLEKKAVEVFLKTLIERGLAQERHRPEMALAPELSWTMSAYLSGPLKRQLTEESDVDPADLDLCFVFGHTHKPFSRLERVPAFSGWTKVYNTGGWVVDRLEPLPVYGASLILVDEALNVAALKLFTQGRWGPPEPVEVRSPEARESPLFQWLKGFDFQSDPWLRLVRLAQEAVEVRAAHLRRRALLKRP